MLVSGGIRLAINLLTTAPPFAEPGRKNMKTISKMALVSAMLATGLAATPAFAADIGACLITKTDTNPFFVKMKEGATAKAEELGMTLKSYAGKVDGDNESQVAAIETCIADGAKGILITPSDTTAIVPTVQKARDAGILVIAGIMNAVILKQVPPPYLKVIGLYPFDVAVPSAGSQLGA